MFVEENPQGVSMNRVGPAQFVVRPECRRRLAEARPQLRSRFSLQ
jgi:hypothetical protein